MMPELHDRVLYRVLRNPVTAADKDYTAPAMVLGIRTNGAVDLVVFPRRADPFQIGGVPHVSDRDPTSDSFSVWEALTPETQE